MFRKMTTTARRGIHRAVFGIKHQDYFNAALAGDLATVAAYTLKKGHRPLKLNAVDKGGNTALIMAAFNGRYDVVVHLLGKQADYKHKNNAGQTAEEVARAQGFTEIANLLHSQCSITPTQYIKAAETGNVSVVQTYVEAKQHDTTAMSVVGEYGNTPLMLAISEGQTYAALVMLEKIYDSSVINAINQSGMTALHWAAFHGDIPCLRALLRKGANIQLIDSKGDTAETLAQNRHFADVAAILANHRHTLERMREITEEEFLKAAERGDLETVNYYLNTRRNNPRAIGISGTYGNTALHLAALHGHTSMVKFLLEALDAFDPIVVKSILDKTNEAGNTALINAAYNGDMPSCIALLQRGANVSLRNKSGINAEDAACFSRIQDEDEATFSEDNELASILSVKGIITSESFIKAAEEGELTTVKLYVAINFDKASSLNSTNALGDTALISAIRNKQFAIADELLKTPNTAINPVNQLGNSALSWAAYHGHKALVEQLIKLGANTAITNTSGQSLIDEVLAKGHIEIANLLAEKRPHLEEKGIAKVTASTIGFAQRLSAIGFPLNTIPEDFLDDITQIVMEDPVQFSSGAIFDRQSIETYFKFHQNPAFIPCPKIPGKIIKITELANNPSQLALRDRIELFVKEQEKEFASQQFLKSCFTPVHMHVQPANPEVTYAQLLHALRKSNVPVVAHHTQMTEVEEKQAYVAPLRIHVAEQKFTPNQEFLVQAFAEFSKDPLVQVATTETMPVAELQERAEVLEPTIAEAEAKNISCFESGQTLFDSKPIEETEPEVEEVEELEEEQPIVPKKRVAVCL